MEIENFIITQPVFHELRIKRSVFLGSLLPAETRDIAEEVIATLRSKYHDATHNCFAYRIDADEWRYSDDGEPSGTAGKPILAMLEKYQLVQCVLVVTRHFGGIKLGTGGLIRAYSQCAEETIQISPREKLVRYQIYSLQYAYHFSRNIHYLVSKFNGEWVDSQFTEVVRSIIRVPEETAQSFADEVLSAGNGQIELVEISNPGTV
ncbi:MAG: YigZ family protein [Calditrichia bacterium]|nr:YigZ family protein [Calditrichia bacterium]